MAIVAQIVGRSFRMIRVIDPYEDPSPTAMEAAIVALNAMMTDIESTPLPMGWQNVNSASDTMHCPPECEQWIAAGLAILLAPEYAKDPGPVVTAIYQAGINKLKAQVNAASPTPLNMDLPRGRGNRLSWNIYTDSPVN
jgi:hypothetical protein